MMKKLLIVCLCFICIRLGAQPACPSNLGFEQGSFNNWNLTEGFIDSLGNLDNLFPSVSGENHTLVERVGLVNFDQYGMFPTMSPNGSNYSVKLGSEVADKSAARMTYDFTVPTNTTGYSIIFNYAIVLQNPNHQSHQQPRFKVKVFNQTDNEYISCSSFDFVAGFSQPDFLQSDRDISVFYKPWSSVTINLAAYAGKSLQLEFTMNDCTLGAHFGYAYIDVNEVCTDPVQGSYICPGFNSTILQAPAGFSNYIWFSGDMTNQLGTGSSLEINNPVIGDSFSVVLLPFSYLGCRDTLRTKIKVGGEPITFNIIDSVEECKSSGANITGNNIITASSPNLTITYHTNPQGTTFVQSPTRITTPGTYYIKAVNRSGCMIIKPIRVILHDNPQFNVADPPVISYPDYIDLSTIPDNPNLSYTFWEDHTTTRPLQNPTRIQTSGYYYIKATSPMGCHSSKGVMVRVKPKIYVPNAFTPNSDGKNDVFMYKASGGISAVDYFNVYNRWGQIIFSTTKANHGWDGKFKGKLQPAGTYVYVFKIRDWMGIEHTHQGVVTLIY